MSLESEDTPTPIPPVLTDFEREQLAHIQTKRALLDGEQNLWAHRVASRLGLKLPIQINADGSITGT